MKFIEVGISNTETQWVNLANVIKVYATPEGSALRFVDGSILFLSHNYTALVELVRASV